MLTINLKEKERREKINFIVEFMNLFKKLRDKERELLKHMLLYQCELQYNILMDYDLKVRMRSELGISEHNFNNLISSMRKKNVIVNNKIDDSYIKMVNLDAIKIEF